MRYIDQLLIFVEQNKSTYTMNKKKLVFLAAALALASSTVNALERNSKMGKPTMEEMEMTTYAPDPEADAVILFSDTDVRYDYQPNTGQFQLIYYCKERIKVLTQEGAKAGNVSLHYFDPESTSEIEEDIRGLKVSTYNLENGKVVRTKMSNDLESSERIDRNNCQVKFAAPNVKVGSVIEYEYKLYSNYFFHPNTWYAQREYPVFYTQYMIGVPDWFTFFCYPSGICPLVSTRGVDTFTVHVGTQTISTTEIQHKFSGSELPAMKDVDFVFCVDDYNTRVEHELKMIALPGSFTKSYNETWLDLAKQLAEDEDFGARFKMQNPLAEEQKALALTEDMTIEERVDRLRELLLSQYKWNGSYSLWGASARKIRNDKDRELNMGSLDFVMMAMLRDAGINATPVVMSRRSKGRLPLFPSSRYFNAMVLQVETSDSTYLYVDPTAEGYPVGTLPPDLMADQGLVVRSNGATIVNLGKVAQGSTVYAVQARVSDDGNEMTGSVDIAYRQENAGSVRESFRAAKDSVEFAQKRMSLDDLEISSFTISEARANSDQVKEHYEFQQQLQNTGDHIYVNPYPFLSLTSPFTAETRMLPVEWPYAVSTRYVITINIPEGYEVEEVPKSKSIKLNDEMTVTSKIAIQPTSILVRLNLSRQSTIMLPDKYQDLRSYYADMEAMTQEMIVLKKKQ